MSKLGHVRFGPALARVERALNVVIDDLNEVRLAKGIGYRLKPTSGGTTLDIQFPKVESPPATGGGSQRMRIVSVSGDFVSCRKQAMDGTVDDTSALIHVAKPHFLRVSVLNGLVVDGWTIGIAAPGNTRTLTATAASGVTVGLIARQTLNYPYAELDTIYADQPEGKTAVDHPTIGGQKIDWLDQNRDARNFHQIRIMLNACVLVGGVPTTKVIVFEAGPVP